MPQCHVLTCHSKSDGELNGETSSFITYVSVSACPASLTSPEIPSRRTRNRISGSETMLQISAGLIMTGEALRSLPHCRDLIQLTLFAVFQEANLSVLAPKTSKGWRMRSECHLFQRLPLCEPTDCSYSYWVAEKSDGVRVLLVVLTNLDTSEQIVCIVRLRHPLTPSLDSCCTLGRPSQYLQGSLGTLLSPSRTPRKASTEYYRRC